MTRLLIMGDPHAHPDYDNDRFERAGRYAIEERADVFVCTGDWFDYASLCAGASRRERESARVEEETAAGHDALRRFHVPFRERKRTAKRRWRDILPECHLIVGNHDVRPETLSDSLPELEGAVARDQYRPFEDAGWSVHPFKETAVIRGWAFCHYMASGTMGRPVGGSSSALLARSLILKGHMDTIVGHDHRFGVAKEERWDGRKLYAFSAGCYVHHEYRAGWCAQTEPMWDRGLLILDIDDEGGHVAHRWTSSSELRRRYS